MTRDLIQAQIGISRLLIESAQDKATIARLAQHIAVGAQADLRRLTVQLAALDKPAGPMKPKDRAK